MNALDFLQKSSLYIWPGSYSVVKAKALEGTYFAALVDQTEITLVQRSNQVVKNNVLEEEKEWKIMTFEAVLPFELTGFLAEVARVLADEGIAIFALSAFSTDHILVKEPQLEKSLTALALLGVKIKEST